MANLTPSAFKNQELLSDSNLQRLAHELARDLYPAKQVMAQHGITEEQYANIVAKNPIFQAYYAESYILWNGTSNISERIKTKAAMMYEEAMPEMMRILLDPTAQLSSKVALGTHIAKIAGLEPNEKLTPQGKNTGNEVHVTINLGHGRQVVIQKRLEEENTIEGSAVEVDMVRPVTQGPEQIPPYSPEIYSGEQDQRKPQGEFASLPGGRLPTRPINGA